MNKFSWLFVSVLVLAAGSQAQEEDVEDVDDEYADIDRAHLVVRKSVKEGVIIQGRNVTVLIDIFNSGSSTASNVELKDTLPKGAKLLEGSLTASWAKISTGSQAKHSYTMIFSSGGASIQMPFASLQYKADDSDETQTGYSSTQNLFVRTPVQHILEYALHGGKYLSLGFAKEAKDWRNLLIVIGIVGGFLGINYSIKAAGEATTSRRRRKALEELKNE